MKLLLTGFEPFGGETVNPSWEAVRLLHVPEGVEAVLLQVPVVFGEAEECVLSAMRREKPDVVICVGQAAGRAAITPERVAINLRDAPAPDNAGNIPHEEPVVPSAPAAYFATLPIRAMQQRMEASGVPAAISNTAGTFVCNSLMYAVLHAAAAEAGQIQAGFIHVPCLPEQAAGMKPGTPSLPLESIVKGLEAAISALCDK